MNTYVTMGIWPETKDQLKQNALDRKMSIVKYIDWLVQGDKANLKTEAKEDV